VRLVHDRVVRDGATASGVVLAAVAAGALQAAAASGSPARGGDEGALVSAAWAATRGVPEAARTFSGVSPTLATAHLAAWDRLTGAAGRAPSAVAGGRELMVLATIAGLGLLWLLARRVGLPRWAAAVALVAAGLSPLAVDLHRTVSPANLAVPWLLAAFVLARSRRPRPATWIGGGACLGAAVAIAPLVAAAAPAAGWQLWRAARPSTRGRALAVNAGALVAAGALSWWLASAVAGGAGRSDLIDLGMRAGRSAGDLVRLDPVVAVVTVVCAALVPPAAARLRPVAAAFWPLVVIAVAGWGGGAGAGAALAVAVPFGALLVAGAAELLWTWTAATRRPRRRAGRPSAAVLVLDGAAPITLVALGVAAVIALPGWSSGDADLVAGRGDAPLRSAERWVAANVPDDARVAVDDSLWVDLVGAGFAPERLAGYGAVGGGARRFDYVVVTGAARPGGGPFREVADVVAASEPVATFGAGGQRVEVRQVRDGAGAGVSPDTAVGLGAAGSALVDNPQITTTLAAARDLRAGRVDQRLLTMLATLADGHAVAVDGFPQVESEDAAGVPARMVDIGTLDGRPMLEDEPAYRWMISFLEDQDAPFRPASTEVVVGTEGRYVLRITLPVPPEPAP
jgi:hypothetical protein